MIPNISERHETIISLLSNYCKENTKGLEAADALKDIVMIHDFHTWKCRNTKDFIGSDEFIKGIALIDALKLKLITLITKF